MKVLNKSWELRELCTKLETNGQKPQNYIITAMLRHVLRGIIDMEAVVDDWPDFTSVLLRPVNYETIKSPVCPLYSTNNASLKNILEEIFPASATWPWDLLVPVCAEHSVDDIKKYIFDRGFECQVNSAFVSYIKQPYNHDDYKTKSLPPDFTLDSCKPEEAKLYSDSWAHGRGDPTRKWLEHIVKHLPSACIRNSSGEPVAWAMLRDDGHQGIGYVAPQYRRRGFARIVGKELTRKVQQMKERTFGIIDDDNAVSMSNMKTHPVWRLEDEKLCFILVTKPASKI